MFNVRIAVRSSCTIVYWTDSKLCSDFVYHSTIWVVHFRLWNFLNMKCVLTQPIQQTISCGLKSGYWIRPVWIYDVPVTLPKRLCTFIRCNEILSRSKFPIQILPCLKSCSPDTTYTPYTAFRSLWSTCWAVILFICLKWSFWDSFIHSINFEKAALG